MLEKTYIVQDALCLNWSRTRERICNAMCCQSALQLNDTKCFPRKTDMSVGETIILVLAYYTWNITQFATERVGFLHLFLLFFLANYVVLYMTLRGKAHYHHYRITWTLGAH